MNKDTHVYNLVTTPIEEKSSSNSSSDSEDNDDSSSEDEDAFPDTKLQSLPHETLPETDKYALEDYGNDEEQPVTKETEQHSRKRFITAKERRMMKKENVKELTDEIRQKQKSKENKPKQQAPAKPKEVVPPPSTRGRKGKAKKIKEKYGDQDEDERQLRMELLGSNKGPQPKGKKAKRQAKAKEDKAALEKERAEFKKAAEEKEAKEKEVKEKESEEVEVLDTGADEKDTEAIRQMLKEENITMLEADEIANLSILDSITGNPLPEDIIHFAIPVCAPYPAIQKYKYKVKLTPGSLKRGKGN